MPVAEHVRPGVHSQHLKSGTGVRGGDPLNLQNAKSQHKEMKIRIYSIAEVLSLLLEDNTFT